MLFALRAHWRNVTWTPARTFTWSTKPIGSNCEPRLVNGVLTCSSATGTTASNHLHAMR